MRRGGPLAIILPFFRICEDPANSCQNRLHRDVIGTPMAYRIVALDDGMAILMVPPQLADAAELPVADELVGLEAGHVLLAVTDDDLVTLAATEIGDVIGIQR